MALPAELKGKYTNEDDFIQRFLIPLLQRLGFSLVVNYHGHAEYGKDLIFAEVDRFGHVRYHGLQAKFEESISLNEVETLISDARQAFNNAFTHPQNGTVERISSFYAVNAGSLGTEAVQHYFNSLRHTYGGNVQLLQGKDLVTLDRWASVNREEHVGAVLSAMTIELRYNLVMSTSMEERMKQKHGHPLERLRAAAISNYLTRPILPSHLDADDVLQYWIAVEGVNQILDKLIFPFSSRDADVKVMIEMIGRLRTYTKLLDASLREAMTQLGPIAGS